MLEKEIVQFRLNNKGELIDDTDFFPEDDSSDEEGNNQEEYK